MSIFSIKLSTVLLAGLMATGIQPKVRILIIGDSISIGYTPYVRDDLADVADVFHNPGNAEHTGTGLAKLDDWIGEEHWDIIQFNWGLWDLCYRHPDSKVQGNRDKVNGTLTFSVEDYAANLDTLVKRMKRKTNARLVFVTTTYVPGDEAGRFKKDPKRYNDVAKKVMRKNGVLVNDVFNASRSIHGRFGKGSDDVHYQPEGSKKLGFRISNFLRGEIRKMGS